MQTLSQTELVSFHRFVGERVGRKDVTSSPEEVLDEWRMLNPETRDQELLIADIQEAIDDLNSGEVGIPFEDFDREFRSRRNLLPKS